MELLWIYNYFKMGNTRILSFLNCCKKQKTSVDPEKRDALAKKRWRKVWILRSILLATDNVLDVSINSGHEHHRKSFFEANPLENINSHPNIQNNWIIYPWNTWKKVWDLCIGAIKMYYCFAIPYYLAFSNHHQGQLIGIDFFFDILLFCDIFFQFSTAFYIGQFLIDDRNKIIFKNFTISICIDIICVVPWYAVYDELMWFRILRLFQIKAFKQALDKSVNFYLGYKGCISKATILSWLK